MDAHISELEGRTIDGWSYSFDEGLLISCGDNKYVLSGSLPSFDGNRSDMVGEKVLVAQRKYDGSKMQYVIVTKHGNMKIKFGGNDSKFEKLANKEKNNG